VIIESETKALIRHIKDRFKHSPAHRDSVFINQLIFKSNKKEGSPDGGLYLFRKLIIYEKKIMLYGWIGGSLDDIDNCPGIEEKNDSDITPLHHMNDDFLESVLDTLMTDSADTTTVMRFKTP